MEITTKYSIGDKVWIVNLKSASIQQVTVGQVRVEITDSPGISGEELFDNYKPQKKREERYMCVETGIGTGSLWDPKRNLFPDENAALAHLQVEHSRYLQRLKELSL